MYFKFIFVLIGFRYLQSYNQYKHPLPCEQEDYKSNVRNGTTPILIVLNVNTKQLTLHTHTF